MTDLEESKCSSSCSKQPKVSNSDGMPKSEKRDRISCLPDEIITHILSFLPTKHAVAASILSRRWRFLWTLVPRLEFNGWSLSDEENKSFVMFVKNRILALNKSFSQVKLNLRCVPTVGDWITLVTDCCMQELDLHLQVKEPLRLFHSIFTCKTLVSLKLGGGISLDVPPTVHLPCLKILHLSFIINLNSESISSLLAGCCVLEDMCFVNNYRDDMKILSICVPTLKILNINYDSIDRKDYKFEIKAPALKHLRFYGRCAEDVIVDDLLELETADVFFFSHIGSKLLSAFRNVKSLILSYCLHSLPGQRLDSVFPKLQHLQRLVLKTFAGLSDVLPILEKSPKVEVLGIEEGGKSDVSWSAPPCIPYCLLHCLQECFVTKFEGRTAEMEMVKYFLKTGRVLEKVCIIFSLPDSDLNLRVREELSASPTASSKCQLVFLN